MTFLHYPSSHVNTSKASTYHKGRRKIRRMEKEVAIMTDQKEGCGWSLFDQKLFYIKILIYSLGRDYADDNDIQQEIAKHLNKKTAEKG
jgi:hypothetical protein